MLAPPTPPRTVRRALTFVVVSVGLLCMPGCFKGDEREKQPPPGYPGGKCLAPDGWCRGEGILCNRDGGAYCFDPADPCSGFFCGGTDRGVCSIEPGKGTPLCQCVPGFNNDLYALYCCPDNPALDAVCIGAGSGVPGDDDGDGGDGDGDGMGTTGDGTGDGTGGTS